MRRQATDSGLRDTVTVAAHCEKVETGGKFVQIVHDPTTQHWLVITNRGSVADTVRIYCSLQMKPSEMCMQSVLAFLNCPSLKVTFELMNVARQSGNVDCGLFAIAFAQCLLAGIDPVSVVFDQSLMRGHLRTCFHNGVVSQFPSKANRVVRRKVLRSYSVNVYCMCRRGCVFGEKMIACDKCRQWFHKQCIRMGDDEFDTYCSDRRKKFCFVHTVSAVHVIVCVLHEDCG